MASIMREKNYWKKRKSKKAFEKVERKTKRNTKKAEGNAEKAGSLGEYLKQTQNDKT